MYSSPTSLGARFPPSFTPPSLLSVHLSLRPEVVPAEPHLPSPTYLLSLPHEERQTLVPHLLSEKPEIDPIHPFFLPLNKSTHIYSLLDVAVITNPPGDTYFLKCPPPHALHRSIPKPSTLMVRGSYTSVRALFAEVPQLCCDLVPRYRRHGNP